MENKIALEEHFSTEQTIGDSQEYFYPEKWAETKRRLLDVGERRIRLMDETGIELAIVSLNSPAIQAIPDPKRAAEIARRANDHLAEQVDKRRDRLRAFAALPLQDPDAAAAEAARCVRDLGFVGALANGFSQVGDAETVVYLDDPRYDDFWRRVRGARPPVLPSPPRPDWVSGQELRRSPVAAGLGLGVRGRDRYPRAPADGFRVIRSPPRTAGRARPPRRGAALPGLAARPPHRQRAARVCGQAELSAISEQQLQPHHFRRVPDALAPRLDLPRSASTDCSSRPIFHSRRWPGRQSGSTLRRSARTTGPRLAVPTRPACSGWTSNGDAQVLLIPPPARNAATLSKPRTWGAGYRARPRQESGR